MERIIPGKIHWFYFRAEEEHKERYRFAANYVKNKTVLDIACGVGYGSAILKRAGAKRVLGIDINKEAINYAHAYYQAPGISFRIGNALAIPSKSKSVDVVISLETIEHVKNANLFLKELARVLKDGGVLILSTPNRYVTNPNHIRHPNPYIRSHLKEFVRKELLTLLKKEGVKSQLLFGQRFLSDSYLRFVHKSFSFIGRIPLLDYLLVNLYLTLNNFMAKTAIKPLPQKGKKPMFFMVIAKKK